MEGGVNSQRTGQLERCHRRTDDAINVISANIDLVFRGMSLDVGCRSPLSGAVRSGHPSKSPGLISATAATEGTVISSS